MISSRCDWFNFLNSNIFSTLLLHVGDIGGGIQIDLIIVRTFSVEKLANSLQALVEFLTKCIHHKPFPEVVAV